ncbi:MAG: response regulator, partial [Spirochaetales bacterium]|nr:response regulator [Spirochaetales bacterium]
MRPFDRLSFSQTIERHPEGLAYVDGRLEILDCNGAFQSITGLDVGPLERFNTLVDERYLERWLDGLTGFLTQPDQGFKCVLRLKEGERSERWVRTSLHSLGDSTGGMMLLLDDITGQKHLEEKLIRARDAAQAATRTKSEFLANTSHEIRTPIHTVIGMAELLEETTLDPEQSDYLGQIQFAAEVLLTLINDILDFSKIEAGQLRLEQTEFELVHMLEDALDLVTLEAHKKNVDTALYVDPRLASSVLGDPTRLRQVIVNLVNNAVKFTHSGQVVVDVTPDEQNPACIHFSVKDSGIGIAQEKQNTLFEAFRQADSSTTRRFGGTGLGLFISRSLVDQMGGALSFTSQAGEGSDFHFSLTLPPCQGEESRAKAVSLFRGKRVLVVDDNLQVRKRLARTLEDWGFVAEEAQDGASALQLLRSRSPYDLVLADQAMPRMDGWQFASEVRSDKSLSLGAMVLLSMKGGSGAAEAKMKLLGWFDAYLTKPVRHEDLAATLARLLRRTSDAPDELEELLPLEHVDDEEPIPSLCILIAEDHEVNRRLLRTILEKQGHRVLEAENGQEAMELVAREAPDMVFMDCQMPVMNGYAASGEIRGQGYSAPIIAVTASAVAEERERCLSSGMDDLVTKPFKQAAILDMISRYLPGNASGDSSDYDYHQGLEDVVESLSEQKNQPEGYAHLAVFDYPAAVATFLGNETTVRKLLKPMMVKIEGELALLRQAVKKQEWETVRTTAHSIKGSCRNMDMNRCGLAAEELERGGRECDANLS